MKFENYAVNPPKNSELEKIINEQADINHDLHENNDSESDKAQKDMLLFLRKPFCCK